MADVKEIYLPKIASYSDIKEVRLVKTDGTSTGMAIDTFINQIAEKVARVDGFASVVAELLVGNTRMFPFMGVTSDVKDIDNFKTYGYMYAYSAVGLGQEGYVLCFPLQDIKPDAALHIFISYEQSYRKMRIYNWDVRQWADWINL